MKLKKKLSKNDIIRLSITGVGLIAFIALAIFIIVKFWPYLVGLMNDDAEIEAMLEEKFRSMGSWAWAALMGCMIIQVVLAVIPNGFFEMLSGLIYGPWLGTLIAVLGSTIGCLIVIYLVKAFGKAFARLFVDLEEDNKVLQFLKNESRCLILLFGFLIIPGMPKDFVIFLVPFTSIKIWKFIIVNFFARLPSTILTVVLGNSIKNGFSPAVITVGVIMALFGIVCLIFNKKISKFFEKSGNAETKNNIKNEKEEKVDLNNEIKEEIK